MSYLIYVNGLGPDYKGDNLYEFIFSQDLDDIWGPSWDSMPSNGYPSPPDLKHITKVGVLRKTEIEFEFKSEIKSNKGIPKFPPINAG